MIYNERLFKPYDERYYVSENGEIYSTYKGGLLKQYIDHDGYRRVDIHGKYVKVHKLVYLVWNGQIPGGFQVLYVGNQKENIRDCIENRHRVGHVTSIVVYDKKLRKRLRFPSVKDFLDYSDHPMSNGSLAHCKNKKWFQDRYDIIKQQGVTTIESYKSIRAAYNSWVEDKAATHEASRVGRTLSPSEAQGTGVCSS